MRKVGPASIRRLTVVAIVILGPAVTLLATACGSSNAPAVPPGAAVAVEGTAQEVLDSWGFVLAERPGDGDALLVIDSRRSDVQLGEHVRVTGALRRFETSKASETHGRPLDLETFARFEGKTYVQAQLVERQTVSTGS